MKFGLVFLFLITFLVSDCRKQSSVEPKQKNGDRVAEMQEVYSTKRQFGDLEVFFKAKIIPKGVRDGINYANDNVYIDYEIKNSGDRSFVVFNRGHLGFDEPSNAVYVEPQPDGSVEISQKAFVEPKNKRCPLRLIPIVPRGSLLKAKQTIVEQLNFELPLKLRTPYADCSPRLEMPTTVTQTKFCLGVAEIDVKQVQLDADGLVQSSSLFSEQNLLCTDVIKLK